MVRSLALVYGNNPRFPWKPSTTMLDNRLTGTRDARRLTATNTHKSQARRPRPAPHDGRHPNTNLRALPDVALRRTLASASEDQMDCGPIPEAAVVPVWSARDPFSSTKMTWVGVSPMSSP